MKSVRRPVTIAATVAAIVLSLPAHAADAPGVAADSGKTMAGTARPAMTRLPSERVAGNGGVHSVSPAASAASRARNSRDVQTTIEDGRTVTRNAHEPHATDAAQTPND